MTIQTSNDTRQNDQMNKRKNYILHSFLAISVFFGVFARIYQFTKVPGGYQMDEAYSGWLAYSLYHSGIDSAGHSFPVYFEAWGHGMNALNSYLMLPFLALNNGHSALWVIRMPQLLVSLASMAAIYFTAKKLFDKKIAAWSLFLLAIFPWHIMMSRWGLESNLAPGFLLFGFCFFLYGMDKPKLLLLSGIFYGLSLYCYATIWTMLPIVILLQTGYTLLTKRIKITKYLVISMAILGFFAFPLICFLLVNMGYLKEFQIGPFSIYKMTMFRGNELAKSFSDLISNFKNLLYLFYRQNVGRPYDVIMPFGFFYQLGRIFILMGIAFVILDTVKSIFSKKFNFSFLLLFQLIGAVIVAFSISVNMTQINCIYLPLILCEAVGIVRFFGIVFSMISSICKKYSAKKMTQLAYLSFTCYAVVIFALFTTEFIRFEKIYFDNYKTLTSAYFHQGTSEAVHFAMNTAALSNQEIWINDALKYPNVLLATETSGREYLDTLIYNDHRPAPASFQKDGITLNFNYDVDQLQENCIYILYMNELEKFEEHGNYKLTKFYDWYVAVPNRQPSNS